MIAVLLSLAAIGCGGGGGSNPVSTTTTPQIYEISPTSGYPGDLVTIRGANFGGAGTYNVVTFNGIRCDHTIWTDTLIYCYVPSAIAGNGAFVVTAASGLSSSPYSQFSILSPQNISVNPTSGIPGTYVTISGTGFGPSSSTSQIRFNGVPATDVYWTSTFISCRVPASSQNGTILTINFANGSTYSTTFNYVYPRASLSAVDSPNTTGNYVGAKLEIVGQGFGNSQGDYNARLMFGSTPVYPNSSSWTSNRIIFNIPYVSGIANSLSAHEIRLTLNDREYVAGSWYLAKPNVSDAAPGTVYDADAMITLNGQYLGLGETSSYLMVGGVRIQPMNTTWTDTYISFRNPFSSVIGSQEKTVYVVVGGVQSDPITIKVE